MIRPSIFAVPSRRCRLETYEAAERGWKTVIALRPDLPEARSNLGLVYHLQKNYVDAIE